MNILRKRRRKTSINITSLIDVLFLLLIFFLVSSTFKDQPGMKLELPESQTAEQEQIKDLILTIEFDQSQTMRMRLNNEQVTMETLADHFKKLEPKLENPDLTLKADRSVDHGTVVQVMDIAKQNNIKKIIIATRFPNIND